MDPIYNSTVKNISEYMYPKKNIVLNVVRAATPEEIPDTKVKIEFVDKLDVAPAVDEPVQETQAQEEVVQETQAQEETTHEAILTRGEASSMKKADLIEAIKLQEGADADVSGTKSELLDRFFPEA